jgi:hypothetical protein
MQKAAGPFDYLQSDAQLGSGLEGIEDSGWYETTPTGQGFAGEPGSIRGDRGPDLAQSTSSLLDKLRKGTSAYSALKGEGAYADAGVDLPYNAYDTSALTAYDTTAGGTRGQVGTGTDVYDVNKLGLLAAVDRIRRSEQEFLVS